MKPISTTKKYRCKVCTNPFEKLSPWQTACGIECALKIVDTEKALLKRAIEKSSRADTKQRKEALKSRSDYVKEAQIAFNAYVRERDKHQPCISCGAPLQLAAVGGGFDCGHYRSVGSAPHLRFNNHNAHGQCKKCNRYLSGNAIEYRRGLIERYGQDYVDILEADQCVRKYTVEGLQAIAKQYKALTKQLKNDHT